MLWGRKERDPEDSIEKKESQRKKENESVENLKKSLEVISESVYHEDIISSFTINLKETIGNRVNKVKESALEVKESINETSSLLQEAVAMIEKLNTVSKEKIGNIIKSNEEIKEELEKFGTNLDSLEEDVISTIEETSSTLSEFSKILKMTERILDISHQTSILALNASIEAARAGEAGKGFSVVAKEIQNLAQDSNQASAEISRLVGELSKKIENSMNNLQKVMVFKAIKSAFTKMTNVVSDNEDFLFELKDDSENIATSMNNGMEMLAKSEEEIADFSKVITVVNQVVDVVLTTQSRLKNVKI